MRHSHPSRPTVISQTRHIRAARAQVQAKKRLAHNLLAIQAVHNAAKRATESTGGAR